MWKGILLAAAVLLAGCDERFGELQHESKVVELDKSELTRVDLKMSAGELHVQGGSPKLLEADFTYNVPGWKPQVEYHSTGVRSDLEIFNPPDAAPHGNNRWDLRLNDNVLMDVVTHLGAGEAHLNLGSLMLRSVEVNIGAGQMDLDLRGHPTRSYDVQVHGGVGQANVYLPASVGIIATASGGIGNINVRGLENRNGRWVNAAQELSPVTIRVNVSGGVGEIDLVAE
jgi:N-terminal domain of toast_rack, DUF2154